MAHIFLASKSRVKLAALERLFPAHAILQGHVDYGALTLTPQPVGRKQAKECCEKRLQLAREYCRSEGLRDMPIIAIESFIDKIETDSGIVWVEMTAVMVQRSWTDPSVSSLAGPPFGIPIPSKFQPSLETASLDYTIGSLIHKEHPQVPADDWYQFAGHAFDRAQVIRHSVCQCWTLDSLGLHVDTYVGATRDYMAKNPMTVYENFPKPGVSFADLFSLTRDPQFSREFVKACANRIIVCDSNFDPDSTCVIGLESRGLMLGYGVAIEAGLPFVPMRKPGKLPGTIEQTSYEKEYGSDVLELQKEHVEGFDTAIIVDDVIATGGSMLAACKLCERLGLKVRLVLALDDIAPLRSEWQQKLWEYRVNILSCAPYQNMDQLSE